MRRLAPLGLLVVVVGAGLTLCEVAVHALEPVAPAWALRAVTIVVVTVAATAAGVVLLRRFESMQARVALLSQERESRQRANARLRRNLARTIGILDAAVDGIVTITPSGTLESLNMAAAEMFGHPAEEVVGRDVDVLLPLSICNECGAYLWSCEEREGDQRGWVSCETRGRRRNGSEFPARIRVTDVGTGDERLFALSVRDMTERKRVEEALRKERDFAEGLIETAPVIVLVLDPDGRILRFNRYMEKISGYRLDEVRGKDWLLTFLPQADHPRVREAFTSSLSDGSVRGSINPIIAKDGAEHEIEWYDTVLEDSEGKVVGILVVGRDVTERNRLEEQLIQAQKMEAIGQLAGGVAHDFNNLLTSIRGSAELLLDRLAEDDSGRRAAERIEQAADQGAAVTEHLLAFSRRQISEPRLLELNDVVTRVNDLVERIIGEDIELQLELDPSPGALRVDPGQLDQVLMNLLVNARDAMPQGGTITIRTESTELGSPEAGTLGLPPGSYVHLSVTDTGEGMDAQTQARVFEPFFTTKEPGKGTGLGLSTVYGIVAQTGGGISIESEPGRGTRLSIFWPRLEPVPSPPARVLAGEGPVRGSETVMLVEDDPLLRELTREVLEMQGYSVLPAASPEEALTISEQNGGHIDLVLTDVVMPEMTGVELAEQLSHQNRGLRVLFMSGYTDLALADRGILKPGANFIRKPFGNRALATKVREILDSAAAH